MRRDHRAELEEAGRRQTNEVPEREVQSRLTSPCAEATQNRKQIHRKEGGEARRPWSVTVFKIHFYPLDAKVPTLTLCNKLQDCCKPVDSPASWSLVVFFVPPLFPLSTHQLNIRDMIPEKGSKYWKKYYPHHLQLVHHAFFSTDAT